MLMKKKLKRVLTCDHIPDQRLLKNSTASDCMFSSRVCVCVYVQLILHHMLGDRGRIEEQKRKIHDLRSECIAAFTH